MPNHKFSILLPVRNGGEYLKDCVGSILSQTLGDFNLHILDSGSTDGTINWLKVLDDERIVIHLSDEPLSMEANWARITTIEKNEFMTIIGHDDLLLPDYLRIMDGLIEKHPGASLYQTHFSFINAAGAELRKCQPMPESVTPHEFLEAEINETLDSMGTGYMMRSRDYDAMGGISPRYPNLIFADYELWMKLTMKGYLATAGEQGFCYRVHESASRQTNGEQYAKAFGMYIQFLAECKAQDLKIAETIDQLGKKFLLNFCESLSHRILKTEKKNRSITAGTFIGKCRDYAALLIPGQTFRPLSKPRIWAARWLDNPLGRSLFFFYKQRIAGDKKQVYQP